MDTWVSIIGTVGFPIAACIALFYFMWTMIHEHKEEINALRGVLEQNTLAIVELRGSIEALKESGGTNG